MLLQIFYRFTSPVPGEFTAQIRDLLIEYLARDLNNAVVVIGPTIGALEPPIAGDFFPVRILASAGDGM